MSTTRGGGSLSSTVRVQRGAEDPRIVGSFDLPTSETRSNLGGNDPLPERILLTRSRSPLPSYASRVRRFEHRNDRCRRGQTGGTKAFGDGDDPFKRQYDRRRHADAESGVARSLPERRGAAHEGCIRAQDFPTGTQAERREEITCK